MEQRCAIILQNYLKIHDYYIHNTDYKINQDRNNNFIIHYTSILVFFIINKNCYYKYDNGVYLIKQYKHNEFLFYYNNKNNKIIYNKSLKLKTINNHKEQKML